MRCSILLLLILWGEIGFSQKVIIKDSLLKIPIENATLISGEKGVVSNQKGVAEIAVFDKKSLITISHVSYLKKKIFKKNVAEVIYLTPKTTLLPMATLVEDTKIPGLQNYPVFTISPLKALLNKTSTSELLASRSSVVVQESQAGGGSPNYRGMEANRLLLVLDGIALNNAIYRSGHVQTSATISPFFLESINLISGPASVSYGNGAMGGAIVFKTEDPKNENKIQIQQQFESSSNAVTTNFKSNYFLNRASHITGFSVKSAGNLRMGKIRFHGYESWGKEPVITNDEEQLYTDYTQIHFLHKSKHKIRNHLVLFNTQYSTSSNIYRFDKMNDIEDGTQKYKSWYYGPQMRFLQKAGYSIKTKSFAFDKIKTSVAFQNIKESRHTQKTGSPLLNNRKENVQIFDINIDFNKKISILTIAYGAGKRDQKVVSNASLTNNISVFYNTTRYPENGSEVQDVFSYGQIDFSIYKNINLMIGGRWNRSKLLAKFNPSNFGLEEIENKNSSFIKSALLSFRPVKNINVNASYYGGFRNPNIDDLGKVFSKDDVNVMLPNENLKPEYTNNFEISFNHKNNVWEITGQIFYTQILNAIKKDYGMINGVDSIFYDGKMMRVQMNKNINQATINGISLSAKLSINDNFLINSSCNYLKGLANESEPLSHIPPFNSMIEMIYLIKNHTFDFITLYNDWKLAQDYDNYGVDNFEEATVDGNPGWLTFELRYTNQIDKNTTFTFAIENLLDAHYKTFGSGISASGRNFILGLSSNF